MKKYDLDQIEKQLAENKMDEKTAVNLTAEIMLNAPALFGLHIYDEDFRSEIILRFLEKGEKIMHCFNSNQGSLFTYLYYNISSLVNALIKSSAKDRLLNNCLFRQSVDEYEDHLTDYNSINIKEIETPEIPFSIPKVDYKDLQKAFKSEYKSKMERAIIVLFIKFPDYLPESTIRDVCAKLGIKISLLRNALEESRTIFNRNLEKNKKIIQSRNKSYYFHNRYLTQIKSIKSNFSEEKTLRLCENQYKYETHTRIWKNKNRLIQRKLTRINTSNQIIAKMLGICERQVRYYLECFRNENFIEKIKDEVLKDII